MKTKRNRKILSSLFALALLATTAVGVAESKKNETTMNDLAMANVEALADGESGGGTKVGYCYINQPFTGTLGWKVFCNSNTSASTIYPCEAQSYGSYLETAIDRCTK